MYVSDYTYRGLAALLSIILQFYLEVFVSEFIGSCVEYL